MVHFLGADKSLEDLYQTRILEFARDARKINLLPENDVRFISKNPLCGDEVTIDLIINKDHIISQYGHRIRGCALCEASSGVLSKNVIGLDINKTIILKNKLKEWLDGKSNNVPILDLQNFSSVKAFQNRHKCVLLSFDALTGACSKILGN